MISRLERHFDSLITKQINAGTFHAVAYRYLKEHTNITLKQPRELKILLKSILNVRKFSDESPRYQAEYLYDLMSLFLNTANANNFADFILAKNPAQEAHIAIYNDVFLEFMELKKQYNYASYDDLLLCYKDEILKNHISFCEVLVDEYQDTNALQNSIITALHTKSLFCVGDYDQSIYAFNGADIGIISSFDKRYKNAKIFSLNKNYRSSKKILAVANKVIENNPRIYPKNLEVANDSPHSCVEVLRFKQLKEQYNFIAKHIAKMSQSVKLSDIAVIFRNNTSSDFIEANLREFGIKCKKKGAKSFFESREITLFIDILSLFANGNDMMAFVHIISNGFQIGEVIAKEMYEALHLLGNGDIINGLLNAQNIANPYKRRVRNAELGLFDDNFIKEDAKRFNHLISPQFASHPLLCHPKINAKNAVFLDRFYQLFSLKSKNLNVVFSHIAKSEFFSDLKMLIAKGRSKDSSDLSEIIANIDKKIDILQNLSLKYDNVPHFLNQIILNSAESSSGDGINLLTIHASKGLEFDSVYIIDLMDGRFPNFKLMAKTGSLEEERRLFYVATTRAKRNLYFCFAYNDSSKNINYVPSIFLKEAGLA